MKKIDFCDKTLIRLKREYSKDEVLGAVIKKLSEKEIEVGKLKAEIDFLQSELSNAVNQKEINKAGKIEAKKNELYVMQLEINRKQRKQIKELEMQRDNLISKCYTLENKCKTANI